MRKICRRCECGCGEITKPGNVYIQYHHLRGKKLSVEHKRKVSKALQGKKFSKEHKRKLSKLKKGKKHTAEHNLNISLAKIKDNPNYPYCEVWHDKEYRKDIRKDYCENIGCNKICRKLDNHHIYLDKKKCAPIDYNNFMS